MTSIGTGAEAVAPTTLSRPSKTNARRGLLSRSHPILGDRTAVWNDELQRIHRLRRVRRTPVGDGEIDDEVEATSLENVSPDGVNNRVPIGVGQGVLAGSAGNRSRTGTRSRLTNNGGRTDRSYSRLQRPFSIVRMLQSIFTG